MCARTGEAEPHLSAQEAVHSRDDKALRRVEDSEEGLEEDGAAVCHGQDSRHPGERQQRQHHTGAPKGGPEDSSRASIRVTLQETEWAEPRPALSLKLPKTGRAPNSKSSVMVPSREGLRNRRQRNRERKGRTVGPEQGPGEMGGAGTLTQWG